MLSKPWDYHIGQKFGERKVNLANFTKSSSTLQLSYYYQLFNVFAKLNFAKLIFLHFHQTFILYGTSMHHFCYTAVYVHPAHHYAKYLFSYPLQWYVAMTASMLLIVHLMLDLKYMAKDNIITKTDVARKSCIRVGIIRLNLKWLSSILIVW